MSQGKTFLDNKLLLITLRLSTLCCGVTSHCEICLPMNRKQDQEFFLEMYHLHWYKLSDFHFSLCHKDMPKCLHNQQARAHGMNSVKQSSSTLSVTA